MNEDRPLNPPYPRTGRLFGKVLVISGAASGIGRAIAQECTSEGASVVAIDINVPGLDTLARDSGSSPLRCVPCDVSVAKEVEGAMAVGLDEYGRIDGIVHSAYWTLPRPALATEEEDWRRTWDVCLSGAFFLAKYGIPAMLQNDGGVIVPIASGHSFVGIPGFFAYQVSEGGPAWVYAKHCS